MKFTIPRESLLKPLQLVTGVVERRQTLPVLANLLIQADAEGLSLTGTDLEVEMIARCSVPVEQPGEITIPARKLADIWRALPDGADVSVSVEGERATIKSGRSRITLATLPAADFHKVENIKQHILSGFRTLSEQTSLTLRGPFLAKLFETWCRTKQNKIV